MKKDEKLVVFGGPRLYREWGYRFTNLGRYARAISAFEKSIEQADTEDLRTLIGWSRALSKFTKYDEAAQIVDKCMEIDPQNYRVKWRRVETLFQIAEFAYSLIHAHQGMTQRRYPFEWGIFQGNETVEDCVGRNTSPMALKELYPWIKNVQEQQRLLIAKLNEEEDEFEGIDDEHSRFKVNDPNVKLEMYLKKLHRVMAETYLGHGAKDRYFLENVLENPSVWSANTKGSQELYNYADRSYKRTCYRQEVLRIRKPFYVFRFIRKAQPAGHKEQMLHEKQLRRYNIVIEADLILMKAHRARMCQDYPLFFNYVNRAKDVFESYSDNMFPLKQRCLNAIYKMASWAYIDTRNLTCFKDEDTKLRYLKHHLGIRVAKLPRDSELGWVPTLNKKDALRTFRKRLALASEPLELSWLFHELSKLLTETRRYDLARFYAKKARDISNEAGIDQWTLNANHVLIRIELDQSNRNEAREAAQLALLNSKTLGIDYLIDFYQRAIKLVDELDFDKITRLDSIETREHLILDLMPSELYTNVDFLLRSMNVVPARRRLTVMPGCKPINHKYKLSCKRNTILPDLPKDPEKEARAAMLKQYAPSKKILAFVVIQFASARADVDRCSDMSSILSNTKVSRHALVGLPEIDLPSDFEKNAEPEDVKNVILKAEARARACQRREGSQILRGTKKQFAEALHQEADALHHRGDYETALILYHRAARAYPRDISHVVAAQRTVAAITSATNPSKALKTFLPKARNGSELAAILCPESAALRASTILRECPNPSSMVSQIFQYFDHRTDFWRMPIGSSKELPIKLARSRIMLRQLTSLASLSSKDLEASFRAGNVTATLRIGKELLVLAAALENPHRHRVTAYRCIALTYVSMGRHDRAVSQVSRMIYSAKMSGDNNLRAQSFVTIGKIHLAFGHLDALARAWENLVDDIQESLPRAWLQHEIGRCYLEMGRYNKAYFVSRECLESARAANSKKWLLHGKLLGGQALIKLGRFAEALEVLRVSARITEEEGDTPTLSYVRDLISQVSSALRSLKSQGCNGTCERSRKLRRSDTDAKKENQLLAVIKEKSNSSRKCKPSSRFLEILNIPTDFHADKEMVYSRANVEQEELECSSLSMRMKLCTEARISKGTLIIGRENLEGPCSISEKSISPTQPSPISKDPYPPDTTRTQFTRIDSPDTSDSKSTGKTYVINSTEQDFLPSSNNEHSASPVRSTPKHNLNLIPDFKKLNGFSNTVLSPESFRSQDTLRTFTVAHSLNLDSSLNIDETYESYESSTTERCSKVRQEFESHVPRKRIDVPKSFQIRNHNMSDNEYEIVESYEKGEFVVDTVLGELVPTGKTCRTETPHSLYRHSLPSDSSREDLKENVAAACQGFTAIFGPI